MDYIKVLEKQDHNARRQEIISDLRDMGITPEIQECRWLSVKNIIADFSPEGRVASLLFTAHYDSVAGSPGANDNASGVAVLLGLCRELKNITVPVRVVFFDREEAWFRTPLLRLGLLGSFCYVRKAVLQNVAEVYNLEFCGQGNMLTIWPVRKSDEGRKTIKKIEEAAGRLSIRFIRGYVPWYLMSSDHFSFRRKGIDAVTLSMLPGDKIPVLENALKGKSSNAFLRPRNNLPDLLSAIHTNKDTSQMLEEKALQSMLVLTLELVRVHSSG
ncbi:MAG: M28 family peptidase [Dehalococcoidales bacterium]|nr:M28 family peptidase [Dehalococcoidales bacterium]